MDTNLRLISAPALQLQLHTRMDAMKYHRVFEMVRDIDDLRTFMQWHVYAVWDFMSLLKRLQRDMTCTELPWMPPRDRRAARLINEIVLGEETDEAGTGQHASHFELYLDAMKEVGASTQSIETFLRLLRNGVGVNDALEQADAPAAAAAFVRGTLQTALYGSTAQVLGSFFYGREDVIPQMFQRLLDRWTVDPKIAPTFVYYLERHIELDGDSHGPAARAMIDSTIGDNAAGMDALMRSALEAVEQRISLWDRLEEQLTQIHAVAA